MNITEAVELLEQGRGVHRPYMQSAHPMGRYYIVLEPNPDTPALLMHWPGLRGQHPYGFSIEDILADDWEVEPV